MKRSMMIVVAAMASLTGATSAAAAVVFSDTFDPISNSQENTPPPNWMQSGSKVDWVKNGDYGIHCAGNTGGCVDLVGTGAAGSAGYLSQKIPLAAGQYQLSFAISGNQRVNSTDAYTFDVVDGSVSLLVPTGPRSETVSGSTFSTVTALFTVAANTDVRMIFAGIATAGNIGALVDNVSISTVPLPAAAWLLLSGLGGVAAFARRRRSAVAA